MQSWPIPQNLEQQTFNGFETDCCWCFSSVVCLEVMLQQLFPTMPLATKNFFILNGYCDFQGNFSLSRRYIAILSGRKNQGDNQLDFWDLVNSHGIIPRSMLDFTVVPQTDPNYQAFLTDFFNPAVITSAMTTLAETFSNYVNVSGKDISTSDMEQYESTVPVQIGIPIPQTVNWNQSFIQWDNSPLIAQHAVVKRPVNADGSQPIIDSYTPWEKTLSKDYPILIATIPHVEVLDISQETVSYPILTWFINIITKLGIWTPKTSGVKIK